jgi:hypothetical protein
LRRYQRGFHHREWGGHEVSSAQATVLGRIWEGRVQGLQHVEAVQVERDVDTVAVPLGSAGRD